MKQFKTPDYRQISMKQLSALICISRSNKKLVPSDSVKFLIWSLPAVRTCPFATAQCVKSCYARKAEKAYPAVAPARMRNKTAADRSDFPDLMESYIRNACGNKAYREANQVVFRIHESGDFYSQDYYNKWEEIARRCSDIKNLVFIAYTKSVQYVSETRPANFKIRYSVWDDTKPEEIEKAKRKGLPVYSAVDTFTTEPEEMRCRCQDCGGCGKCWSDISLLLCEIH